MQCLPLQSLRPLLLPLLANYSLKRTAADGLFCYHTSCGSGRLAQALAPTMRRIALLLAVSLLSGCAAMPNAQELRAAFEVYGEPVPPGTIIAEVASIE